MRESCAWFRVQEVALVFRVIERLQQLETAVDLAHAGVMPCRNRVGAKRHRVVKEGLELDLGVAEHVGIGRAAGGVFAQEVRKHAVFVLRGKVDGFDVNADQVGHRDHVDPVLPG